MAPEMGRINVPDQTLTQKSDKKEIILFNL